MLLPVRQENQITCLQRDVFGIHAEKASPFDHHMKTGAIID
jgi:hypothetical protein